MNQQSIIEHINYLESQGALIQFFDKAWLINGGSVSWSLQPNMEFECSSFTRPHHVNDNGLVFVETDSGCGYNITMVFLESEEIKDD